MAVPHIEIKSKKHDENGTIFTEIFVNGHPLREVRRFELKREVGDSLPILTVDLNAFDLSVDTDVLRINQHGLGEIEKIVFKDECEEPSEDGSND